MELKEVIQKRRSIRKYLSVKVDNNLIEEVLYQGTLAPSAKNGQPWRFVVIQEDTKLKEKIADLMIAKAEERIAEGLQGQSIINTANIMKQAPVLILVFNIYKGHHPEPNIQSVGACIENMCLTATDLGLGSLWIANTLYVQKEIEDLFPEVKGELLAAVSLGYADENPEARPRKKLEELTSWI